MSQKWFKECESEQLHLSGKIQPHGAMLVVSSDSKVTHFSENVGEYIPVEPTTLLGKSLPTYLLKPFSEHQAPPGKPSLKQIQLDDWPAHEVVIIQNNDGSFLLELYRADEHPLSNVSTPNLGAMISNDQELKEIQHSLVSWIAEITGHERAMYYQFIEDGDGHVTEEFCSREDIGSYLDLRFPASDIPHIARSLYLKSDWRMIPNASADSINLVGLNTTPDLTFSDLRSVSPVHQVYMSNMGVGSSISFPIVRNDELDALISCHSSKGHYIPRENLIKIQSVLSAYNTLLKDYDLRMRMQVIDEFNLKHTQLRILLAQPSSIENSWAAIAAEISHNFAADGVILCTPTNTLAYGLTPDLASLEKINNWFNDMDSELVTHTQHLSYEIPDLSLCEASGVSAIKFRYPSNNRISMNLYLLREEYIHEVTWGGNPNKPQEHHDGEYGISPRQSFSKWVEKRIGHCRPWPKTIRLELLRLKSILEQGQYTLESE